MSLSHYFTQSNECIVRRKPWFVDILVVKVVIEVIVVIVFIVVIVVFVVIVIIVVIVVIVVIVWNQMSFSQLVS